MQKGICGGGAQVMMKALHMPNYIPPQFPPKRMSPGL